MYEQFYIDTRSVPNIFKIADREMEEKFPPNDRLTKPKEIPMPYINSNPNVPGPIYVTNDWYYKKKKKKMIERAKETRDVHIEMMQLLARKDMLRIKLGKLDPSNKKDSKKIVAINVKLKDINAELEMLSWQYNIDLEELDKGSRLGRFIGRMKRKVKKITKVIRNLWEDHSDFILSIGSIILPFISTLIFKKIF